MKYAIGVVVLLLAGFLLGRYGPYQSDTSASMDSLASVISKAQREALEASETAESLAVVAREAGTLRDSVGALQTKLLRRPRPPAPLGTASDSVRYWEERARAVEADLFDYQRLDAIEDSVQQVEVDAWKAAYETERQALQKLLTTTGVIKDSLDALSPKVARLERQAGKVCSVGPAAGVTTSGNPALVFGVTCDGPRLIGKVVGAIF